MKSRLKLTSRGYKILIFLTLTSILSLTLRDEILAIAAMMASSMMIFDAARLLNRLRKFKGGITPSELSLRVRIGEQRAVSVTIDDRIDDIELEEGADWIKVSKIDRGQPTLIELQVNPRTSGKLHLKSLRAKLKSDLGFMASTKTLSFDLSVVAYPRFLLWMLEAIAYLYGAEARLVERASSKASRLGFEYYGSRELSPSDNPKFIDWRATARTLRPMVKEFLEERMGLDLVLYDDESLGPTTRDEQLSLLLSTLLALALSGEPMGGFVLKSGKRVLYSSFKISPQEALKIALAHIIESHPIIRPLLYEVLDPRPARTIMKILDKIKAEGLEKVIKYKLKAELTPLSSIVKPRMKAGGRVLYVGTIICDAEFLLEMAYAALSTGAEILVLTPSRPWIDALPGEESKIRSSHDKLVSALNNLNVKMAFYGESRP